jgi:hypothetical protein
MSKVWECGRELADQMAFLKEWRGPIGCVHEFDDVITVAVAKCVPEFYKLCDLERLIRICPFDPAWDAFEWKQQVLTDRLEALEVQVKELGAKR